MVDATDFVERFWGKVDTVITHPLGCWPWEGARNSEGYGYVRFEGRYQGVHRVCYQIMKGAIPKGLVVDHLCRTRNCVNLAHLELVTPGENARRGIKGDKGLKDRVKTHCPQGHEYTGTNLSLDRKGYRECRNCQTSRRERHKARKLAGLVKPSGRPPKTHCKRGHEFDDANTRHYAGSRFCRACERLRKRT